MKNLVSIFAGHDANVSFWNAETDKYYTIEIERLVQQRYFRLHEDNTPHYQQYILEQCRDIAEEEWGIENRDEIREYAMTFNWKNVMYNYYIPEVKKIVSARNL